MTSLSPYYPKPNRQTKKPRQKVDVEPLLTELKAHLSPTDLASLRGITDEIRQRIERFGGQFR
ncbi:MAG TPA: hypothetical protein VGP73_03215 [Thermoanaerobaculia bacterium]